MNELKPEDVMRELEEWVGDFHGTATQFVALCNALALLREKDAHIKMLDEDRLGWADEAVKVKMQLNEKDAEIERLKNSITFQVVMPDEKMEEIKAECLARVELDIKEIRAEAISEFAEMLFETKFRMQSGGAYYIYADNIYTIEKEMRGKTDGKSDL